MCFEKAILLWIRTLLKVEFLLYLRNELTDLHGKRNVFPLAIFHYYHESNKTQRTKYSFTFVLEIFILCRI